MQLQWNDCDHEFRFQASLKKYGVPEEEIFQTADLYERRNIPQVTLCIYALARLVSTSSSVSLKLQIITENNQTVGGCSDSETSGVHWSSSGPENGGREQTWVHRRATPCQWRPRGIAGWLQQGRQSSWCRFFRQHSTYVNPSRGRSPGWSWLVQVPTVALIGTDDDDSSSNRFLQWIYLPSFLSLSLSLLHLSLSLSLSIFSTGRIWLHLSRVNATRAGSNEIRTTATPPTSFFSELTLFLPCSVWDWWNPFCFCFSYFYVVLVVWGKQLPAWLNRSCVLFVFFHTLYCNHNNKIKLATNILDCEIQNWFLMFQKSEFHLGDSTPNSMKQQWIHCFKSTY